MKQLYQTFLFVILSVSSNCLFAQTLNPIITAFPSLRIPSSSRGLAMGDCGVASAEDNQQLNYNAAKTAFTQYYHRFSINYSPWLAAIASDTRVMNINYVANLSTGASIGFSLNYLRLGNQQTRDNNGTLLAQYTSNEYNVGTSIGILLTKNASIGVGLHALFSQPGQVYDPVTYTAMPKQIVSACADVSFYQKIPVAVIGKLEIGGAISNFGPKISLDGSGEKAFLPTNLSVGIAYTQPNADKTNQFTIALDANKLMVPTPPIYGTSGNIIAGKDPNRSILNALFSSFSDAPGGFNEELREIRLNAGAEFAFEKAFFLRSGISLENKTKGNRKFIGFGVGYKGFFNDQEWGIDFHYLVPFGSVGAISPFQNSWGFGLKFGIGSLE